MAAAGGLLTVIGLNFILLSEDLITSRGGTALVAFLFTTVGVLITFAARTRRAVAGGVVISALSLVPLVNAIFVDISDPFGAFADLSGYRNAQMGVLSVLAVLWLAAYLVSPARGNAFYLGAALVALWLLPMTWFSLSSVDDALGPLGDLGGLSLDLGSDTSDPFGDVTIDGSDTFGDSGTVFEDDFSSDLDTDSFGVDDEQDSLATKLGITSLLFGLAYLAAGAVRDRAGDARMGTPFFGVAIYVLWQATTYLANDLEGVGIGLLGIALGGAGVVLGAHGGRRATSWLGAASIVGGFTAIVVDALDSPGSAGTALAIVGALVVLAALIVEGEDRARPTWTPINRPDGGGPTPPTDPAAPGVPGATPAPAAPARPAAPEAWAPPSQAPAWGGTHHVEPPAAPAPSVDPPAPSPWAPPPAEPPQAPPPTG